MTLLPCLLAAADVRSTYLLGYDLASIVPMNEIEQLFVTSFQLDTFNKTTTTTQRVRTRTKRHICVDVHLSMSSLDEYHRELIRLIDVARRRSFLLRNSYRGRSATS